MISKLARFTLVPLFAVSLASLASGAAWAQEEGGEMPAEGTEAAPMEAAPATEAAPMETMDAGMDKKMWIGADAGILVPVLGNYGDAAGIGFAGHLTFSYVLSPMMHVTARAGYHHHLAKNEITVTNIPILAGIKYYFGMIYASAEVGLSMNKVKFGDASASQNKFASAVGVGYTMGKLDIRAGAFMPSTADAGDGIDIMATVGMNFAGF